MYTLLLNGIYTAYKEKRHTPQADVDRLGIFTALFAFFYLLSPHTIIMSSSRLLIYHQTVTLGYQSIASGSVVSGFARETSVQTKPQQCQREKHTHTISIRKSPNQKKKRTKERGEAPAFPLLPPNPCPPSLPPMCPSPLSPKIRSKGQKKREEEEKEKRSGAEEPKV